MRDFAAGAARGLRPPGVKALRNVSLSIGTVGGPAELAPVLTSLGYSEQRVTIDGENPARFTRRRCKAIGCSATVAGDAARGKAPAPTPRGAGFPTDEPAMRNVLRAALGRARRRR
jgi:hypothetical protein